MPTIEKRTKSDGKEVYRVKVRRRGYSTQTATFSRLTDARKWAQRTEAAIEEGRHFKTTEAKRHTLAELVDRYVREVLPGKSASSISSQTQQLGWWKEQLGFRVLVDITPSLIYRRSSSTPPSPYKVARKVAADARAPKAVPNCSSTGLLSVVTLKMACETSCFARNGKLYAPRTIHARTRKISEGYAAAIQRENTNQLCRIADIPREGVAASRKNTLTAV
jgi:hypothetical protein